MAQNAPPSQDIQDIQFKLHNKFTVFPESKEIKSLVSLLAVSAAKGLLFAGNQNAKELKVFKLRDVVNSKTTGHELKVRVVNLPGEPKSLACSCDGSMLAVNYILNNTGFLQIYQVESFLMPTLNLLYNLPVAPESNVFALQLLWNPVISNNIALILSNGSVAMYTLNNGGEYERVTLGQEHQVRSGCWSPKGKQIVFGFSEGKLQQFKPNLQAARAIPCPPGIHPGPFDCIAIHWLSTFQFAVIFLQRGQDMCPSLFVVNAPKAGQPTYINYYDICYSAPGPRTQQLSFTHIPQWNILLITSANGVELGVLGTKESGENPNWIQYTLLDEARIEMPLTESKDETYPLGFAYDTTSSHQVAVGEKKLPVMPMIHVLSTHGHLVSYNFLNLSPNAVDVCSPPSPLNDASGQFKSLSETMTAGVRSGTEVKNRNEQSSASKSQASEVFGDMAFSLGSNVITSTPTVKDKPISLFSTQTTITSKPTSFDFSSSTAELVLAATTSTTTVTKFSTGFGVSAAPLVTSAPMSFSQQLGSMAAGYKTKSSDITSIQPYSAQATNLNKSSDVNKPLYTVPATFTPPAPLPTSYTGTKPKINLNTVETDELVKQMIVVQIESFETELEQIKQQSNRLLQNMGSPDEIKPFTKQLNNLQEIIEQANDHEFEQDVQVLRHSMSECYAMLAECRTKLDLYNNPDLTSLSIGATTDPTSRRQLAKLQAYVASNKNELSQLNELIEAQWSQYQDVVRRNSKNHMHIPCLDGIYQRMSKLKDLLSKQRTKINYIKTKLKQKGLNYKPPSEVDVTSVAVGALTKNRSTMESLADSILSMSLSKVVSQNHAKLSQDKLNAIRNFTKHHHQINIIKPKRPDRIGLKSEVILETKLETERKQTELARRQQQQQQELHNQLQQQYKQHQHQFALNKTIINVQEPQKAINFPQQLQQQLIKPQVTISTVQQQSLLAKPTASKPSVVSSQPPTFIMPTSSNSATLSFGGNSSFVKTSISTTVPKSEETPKPMATSTSFVGFGMTPSQTVFSAQARSIPTTTSVISGSKENAPINTPISFSAKVIGGNGNKPFANLNNKSIANNKLQSQSQGFALPTSTTSLNQGFSAFATTKSVVATINHDKDEGKKSEEIPKSFDFSTTTMLPTTTTTTSAPYPFEGFSITTKSTAPSVTATSTPFATPLFGSSASNTNNTTTTPFGCSPFSFNATTSVPSTASSFAVNTSTKTVTTKIQPTGVVAKPAETKTAAVSSTTNATPATSVSFSFNSPGIGNTTNASSKSSETSNVTITSTGLSEPKPAVIAPTSNNSPTPAATGDASDFLFSSLNICKPTPKDAGDSNKPTNIFSGLGATTSTASSGVFSFSSTSGARDGVKSFLGSTNVTSTTPSSGFSFATGTTAVSSTENINEKPITTGTGTSTADSTTTTLAAATITSAESSNSVATNTTTSATATAASSFPFGTIATTTASTAVSLFGSLSPPSSTTASTVVSATTTTTAGNIFGGGTSLFGQATTATTTGTTASLFGGGAAVASPAPSLFGSVAATVTTATTPGSSSVFGAAAPATSPQSTGNIFGGIPKPEQSVFISANTAPQPVGTGLFAAAAANTKPPAATGGSIFGGAATTGFGSSSGGSIFGGGNTASSSFGSTSPSNISGSIFGAATAATKPAESSNIFGSPTQQSATSGGSIFGKSTFSAAAAPQPTGNIFVGSSAQSPTSGGFGASGGSIFGGSSASNTSTSGGSLFANAPAFGASTGSSGFGSFSQPSTAPAFGSPTGGGFGAPASTAFASSQQQSAFAKPVFGGPAAFGSPQPAFGAPPTFGGAPAFGSPKGFGSFASTSPTSGFGAAAQGSGPPKGNIFETLGSQDSGLSFGNLAHSTQAPQPKPAFGGSSFMNYRS